MAKPLSIGFDVPFAEAARVARERGVVLPDVYYGELRGVERLLAFSVAGLASFDQLQGVKDSLTQAVESGQSFAQWKKSLAVADLELPEYRLDNIFRTNLQGVYMAGMWEQFERNKTRRPYLMYDAINDSRVRPAHLALDNVIRPVDDSFWKSHSPPNGYRCRCSLVSLTERQAFDRSRGNQGLHNPAMLPDGRHAMPDEGWEYTPNERLAGVKRAINDRVGDSRTLTELRNRVNRAFDELDSKTYWGKSKWSAWHDKSFADSPAFIKQAVGDADTSFRGVGSDKRNPTAYYDPGKRRVYNMGNKAHIHEQATWRHEFGHFIDNTLGTASAPFRSEQLDFVAAVAGDARAQMKLCSPLSRMEGIDSRQQIARDAEWRLKYDNLTDEMASLDKAARKAKLTEVAARSGLTYEHVVAFFDRETIFEAGIGRDARMRHMVEAIADGDSRGFFHAIVNNLGREDKSLQYQKGATGKFSDLIGCATRNGLLGFHPTGYGGHSDRYLNRKGNAEAEVFANLTCLLGSADPVYQAIVDATMPRTVQLFREIMSYEK